jgi:hypothetical protein
MKSKWIIDMAQDVVARQSFEHTSFIEAKDCVCHKNICRNKYIVYDRLSFWVYEHNLSSTEFYQFGKELKSLYIPPTNEYDKCRLEYGVLFRYYHFFNPTFANYNITKNERPDFILRNGKYSIGIEVTQLTTPYEQVMGKISSLSENGISADELKMQAENKHGRKAEKYRYYEIGDSASVGTETLRPDTIREMFVAQIIEKYEKYKNEIQNFDKFIILCDANQGITLTSEEEADEIHNMLNLKLFNKSFRVAILWCNNQLFCSEYQFGPSTH